MKQLLIVEDDLSLANRVALALKGSEYSFVQAQDLLWLWRNVFKMDFQRRSSTVRQLWKRCGVRISPVGFAAETESELRRLSEAVTGVTHNYDEGLKGADLNDELLLIFNDWSKFTGDNGALSRFHVLTKYIGKISEATSFGKWLIDKEGDGKHEHPFRLPYVKFN
ncbi:hypothetical protein NIE88_02310 [Sporolactobacillus shoreicorticis]|uniref:Response regulator n=1 Tax=Sporolactobacillus shoreicorticis TaxID=1923877 RepID=A0ABW5S0D5_9BACL|nr:hypothetical protein [Sporolactobacillus shoreicorticis]MCO7124613.1 hypothetical protein [Sporolactobacillus shoreicorticis]